MIGMWEVLCGEYRDWRRRRRNRKADRIRERLRYL